VSGWTNEWQEIRSTTWSTAQMRRSLRPSAGPAHALASRADDLALVQGLRPAVRDGGIGFDPLQLRDSGPLARSGRGLVIGAALSDAWEVELAGC
jgi:hypothetical protein